MMQREQTTCQRRDVQGDAVFRRPMQALRRNGRTYLGRALSPSDRAVAAQGLRLLALIAAGLTVGAVVLLAVD